MGLIPGSSIDEGRHVERNKDLPMKKEIFIDENLDDFQKQGEVKFTHIRISVIKNKMISWMTMQKTLQRKVWSDEMRLKRILQNQIRLNLKTTTMTIFQPAKLIQKCSTQLAISTPPSG